MMKPGQWSSEYAQIFKDQSVVEDYRFRPGYPPETFDILEGLMTRKTLRRVLDVGCGTGFLARKLTHYADHVDAVDFSAAAIEQGKSLHGGDSPRLHWICAPAEEAGLDASYDLITAGASLHWMDWDVVLPMFGRQLRPGAYLALVENVISPPPWTREIQPVIAHFSMNKEYRPYDNRKLAHELEVRRLFETAGEKETQPITCRQSVGDYIQSFHARNGLSRERLGEQLSQEFDDQLTDFVAPHCPDGCVTLSVSSRVIWGLPAPNGGS